MGTKERRGREEQARLSAILGAAESVFARKGYHETRMDDIADQAELAKGTLYYYFRGKDEIYTHLLAREADQVYDQLRLRIPPGASFLRILEVVTEFSVEYFEAHSAFLRLFLPCMCDLVQVGDTATIDRSRRAFDRHAKLITQSLQKAIEKEKLPFSLERLGQFLMTMERGIGLMILEGHVDEARQTARFFVEMIKFAMEKNT